MSEPARAPTPSNLYSFSRLKTFHQCPARYRYRYLKGLQEAFRSIESFLGNTVHSTLEWLYRERDANGSPDERQALEAFTSSWKEQWSDAVAVVRVTDDSDAYFRLGCEMLSRFVRDTFARDRSETVSLEQRLSVRLSETIVFTGFADRVGRTDVGRLFIVDYKTSKTIGDPSEYSEGLQVPLYAACALRHSPDAEALAGYHYLRHGSTRWQSVDETRARELLERCLELAESAAGATDFPARPGVLCAWCGFNHICSEAEVTRGLAGGLEHAIQNAGSTTYNSG